VEGKFLGLRMYGVLERPRAWNAPLASSDPSLRLAV
jgi:hypothetical protein